MIPVYALGALVILALCAYELRRPEVDGWVKRQRARALRVWRDLFDYEAGASTPGPSPSTTCAADEGCDSCRSLGAERQACSASKKDCGHHCNHSWSHERCCWCGEEWGEETGISRAGG